jgi:hypothetical protein
VRKMKFGGQRLQGVARIEFRRTRRAQVVVRAQEALDPPAAGAGSTVPQTLHVRRSMLE